MGGEDDDEPSPDGLGAALLEAGWAASPPALLAEDSATADLGAAVTFMAPIPAVAAWKAAVASLALAASAPGVGGTAHDGTNSAALGLNDMVATKTATTEEDADTDPRAYQ